MLSMQSKMLAEFDRLITAPGFEAVEIKQWANTGHLHAQRGFRTMLDIDYAFHADYCTIQITGPAIESLVERGLTCDNPPQFRVKTEHGKSSITWFKLDYGTERVEQMFVTVGDILGYATSV